MIIGEITMEISLENPTISFRQNDDDFFTDERIQIYSDWPGGGALLYFLLPIAVVFLGKVDDSTSEKTWWDY